MLRTILTLAIALHSSTICLGMCAEDEPAACETAKKPSCCQKESAKRETSSCCCSPTAKHPAKPKGEDCRCCISPNEPLGMPAGSLKLAPPAVTDIIVLSDGLPAGWAAISHDKHSTENWLMWQGASISHSILCVWIN